MNKTSVVCSVCILTYKRLELLKKLFDSLISQKFTRFYSIEYLVIDNDPMKSSENLIEQLKERSNLNIKYFCQPLKNLSISRNLAVEEAGGEFIAFIDDDEFADENWLNNLILCIRKYDSDVVFGALDLYYEDGIPEYLRKREFFFPENGETGNAARYFFTGNCIVRSETIKTFEKPFDLKYGIIGGEDANMFERLLIKGAKLICCKEAVIWEFVPNSRGNVKYLLKRNFRSGNGFIFRQLDLYGNNFLRRMFFLSKAVLKFSIYFIMIFVYLPSKQKRLESLFVLSDCIGKISAVFNYTIKLYK